MKIKEKEARSFLVMAGRKKAVSCDIKTLEAMLNTLLSFIYDLEPVEGDDLLTCKRCQDALKDGEDITVVPETAPRGEGEEEGEEEAPKVKPKKSVPAKEKEKAKTKAKKGNKPKKTAPEKQEKKEKTSPKPRKERAGPTITSVVLSCLKKASKTKPVTKDELFTACQEAMPGRSPSSLLATIGSMVPTGLRTKKGVIVERSGPGYYVPRPKAEKVEE